MRKFHGRAGLGDRALELGRLLDGVVPRVVGRFNPFDGVGDGGLGRGAHALRRGARARVLARARGVVARRRQHGGRREARVVPQERPLRAERRRGPLALRALVQRVPQQIERGARRRRGLGVPLQEREPVLDRVKRLLQELA